VVNPQHDQSARHPGEMRGCCDMHGRVVKLDHPAAQTVAGGGFEDNFATLNHQPRGAPPPPPAPPLDPLRSNFGN
jgi:hypothetical protein